MRAVGQPDRRRRARDLLQRDAMLEIAEPRAAILLLDRDAMQAERADLRPEIAGELVALVDFGGARRDLVARESLHGLADRVGGLAEIEIEHPMRVGDHGRAASWQAIRDQASAICVAKSLSRAGRTEKALMPRSPGAVPIRWFRRNIRYSMSLHPPVPRSMPPDAAMTALALPRARGCNSHQIALRRRLAAEATRRHQMHGTIELASDQHLAAAREHARSAAAGGLRSSPIPNCSRPIRSGRISTGCARKSRCTTARTACSARIGR